MARIPSSAGETARRRVLLIGPDPSPIAHALRGESALGGVEIDEAPGNVTALQQLRLRDCDAVVTDPNTSIQEDLAFVEEIRAIRPRARILVLAPVTPQVDLIAALRANVFACFAQPFDLSGVAHMVRTALADDAWRDAIEVLSGLPHWITLRISSRLVTAERLIHFMNEYRSDVGGADRDTLMLAFREVLMNAIEHGAGFDAEQALEVSAARTDRAVVYYIRDPGPGFRRDDLAHAAVADRKGDPISHLGVRAQRGMRPGGFGILITRKLVDELVYNEKGNQVILVKYTDR